MIVVIDYGMGNLRSVSKALESLGATARVSSDPHDVATARKLILPGVGAFPAAMRELAARRLIEPITTSIARGVPYLGICLGLQLLFEGSTEGTRAGEPAIPGLGILKGKIRQFPIQDPKERASVKVPHMGWNCVESPRNSPFKEAATKCPLMQGIASGSFFYFVHSYCYYPLEVDPELPEVDILEAQHGAVRFASMVWRGNLYATQFHPEKSQAVGLQLLKNFITL